MTIGEVEYEIIEYPRGQQFPKYRRSSDGSWEIEQFSHTDDCVVWFHVVVEELERQLEEEYQAHIKGE